MVTDFAYMTALEIRHLVSTKQASAVEVVRAALDRLDYLEPTLNAFVTRTPELALEAAREADAEVMKGAALGPLLGVPISVKDLIDVADVRTTFPLAQGSWPITSLKRMRPLSSESRRRVPASLVRRQQRSSDVKQEEGTAH